MTQTPDLEAFFATLEQLPPHVGVVFRGCEARSHERWAGRAHVTETLLSTSRDPRVATENFTTEAVYAILSRAGRGDRAVLGSPSRARGRLPAGHDLHAGHAREGQGPRRDDRRGVRPRAEPPPVDFAALQEEIGRAILEAELREPVPQPIAGKFAGDIA